MTYRDSCPKQVITKVHHTIATWLPVTLSCGHIQRINWTANEGQSIGCTDCAHEIKQRVEYLKTVRWL